MAVPQGASAESRPRLREFPSPPPRGADRQNETMLVVNWSIPSQLIDQFPMAVVVINSLPFRGELIACLPAQENNRRHADAAAAAYRVAFD